MDLSTIFLAVTLAQGLPPRLLEAVCWVESQHTPEAIVPHDGATASYGICQVKKKTCESVGVRGNLQDPKKNIECAGRYLRYQIARYGDTKRAVCAYNRGRSTGNGNNRYTRKVYTEWHRRTQN